MNEDFINRIDDVKKFKIILKNVNYLNKNKIIFLSANSGIGKSSFTAKLLQEQSERIPIKVKMLNADYKNGDFISNIAKSIHELSNTDSKYKNLSLEKYIKITYANNKIYRNQLFNSMTKALKLLKPLKIIIDRETSSGDFNSKKIIDNYEDTVNIILEYLYYIFQENKIILNIENIQCIDVQSNDLLKELTLINNNNIFIFEFTNDSKNIIFELHELIDFFRTSFSSVIKEELQKIPLTELLNKFINTFAKNNP